MDLIYENLFTSCHSTYYCDLILLGQNINRILVILWFGGVCTMTSILASGFKDSVLIGRVEGIKDNADNLNIQILC